MNKLVLHYMVTGAVATIICSGHRLRATVEPGYAVS
jgi:hypothetical protein